LRAVKLISELFTLVPVWLIVLASRLAMWNVFWYSARTKAEGWLIWLPSSSAVSLFEYEYQLPSPYFAAAASSLVEHVCSVLILVGLATRWAAAILLVMTVVIALIYPANWGEHLLWAVCLMLLVREGGGFVSLDKLVARRYSH